MIWALLATASMAAPPQLAGTWVHEQITTTISELPVVGTRKSRTRAKLMWTITQQGTRIRVAERLCWMRIGSPDDPVRVKLSPGLRRAVARDTRSGTLVGPQDGRWRLVLDERVRVVGAALDSPETEALPTLADDARVRDTDNDGAPGVTVQLRGIVTADLHVVQRDRSAMHAVLPDSPRPDAVQGSIDWSNEQRVLSSTSWALSELPESRPDLRASGFRLRRVADGTTCTRR